MRLDMIDGGFKKLEVYMLAHQLAVEVHAMTLKPPKVEVFEEASQIRRSSKSVSAQIVEGYSLRKYKNEYLHYLYRSYASAEETIEHLEYLFETKSLTDAEMYKSLRGRYEDLCKKEFKFIQAVEGWTEPPRFVREEGHEYGDPDNTPGS
jgi:four helix bundle protein